MVRTNGAKRNGNDDEDISNANDGEPIAEVKNLFPNFVKKQKLSFYSYSVLANT